ncbi:MAG: hypothetical protein H9W80_12840 [Enterococcus sp.]|nr:hypothetical protein [Enterococcus sp.]
MFFRKMNPSEVKSSEKAWKVALGFYLLALLAHALYAFFVSFEFNSSFVILMGGFFVFSVSEFFFNKRARKPVE